MASAFWGGFANTLGGIMDERRQREEGTAAEMQKARMLKELEKEFGAEIVDPSLTRIEGNEEVRYNKYGTAIARRALSPEEIEARQLESRRNRAQTSEAESKAAVAGLDAQNYSSDREYERSVKERQLGVQGAQLDLARRRLSLDEQRLSPSVEKDVNEVISALNSADGTGGIASAENSVDAFMADLEAASTDEQKRRVIAEWKGVAARLVNQRKFEQDKELRGGGAWSMGSALPTPRGP